MKALLLSILLLFSLRALAQSAILVTPQVPPTTTALVVGEVHESRAPIGVLVIVWKVTTAGEQTDAFRVQLTTNAEVAGYLNAIETTLTGEPTGTTLAARARRHQGRILNYLVTACATLAAPCPPELSSATMVP